MNNNVLRLGFVTVVAVGLFVAGGCLGIGGNGPTPTETPAPTTAAEPGDVTGVVVDPNLEEPIAGAAVSLNGNQIETGEEGTFEFTDVSPGEYELSASKTGYAAASSDVTVSGDRSVEIALKNDKFYEPNETELGAVHIQNEGSCSACHAAGSPTAINDSASDDSCLTCHSQSDVINSTADLTHNPHDDPHGYGQDCGSCHKIHSASVDSCADCHPDDWVPQPP
jgi:hypothetical protein